jgi:hypothetical protein
MKTKLPLVFLALSLAFTACKKDKDDPTPAEPGYRTAKVDYNALTATTSYNSPLFFDNNGDSTVDRTEGRVRLLAFKGLDAYAKVKSPREASVLKNMFSNTGNPFSGDYASLNTSGIQIRNTFASSYSQGEADIERQTLEAQFDAIAIASASVTEVASKGKAGLLTNVVDVNDASKNQTYLVDAKGMEISQVIQKSMIGGYQLDYICNVLLDKGLEANNTQLVVNQKYTALEHNWDVAYGLLTVNDIYNSGATDVVKNSKESLIGSYVWEYNKEGYKKIHSAFLKGRAAIINNDKVEIRKQAELIRSEFEKAIAGAAVGYLGKWKTGTNDAVRAHAIGEGAGFIYSLRFCTFNGADATFSNGIYANLFGSENGFWDLTNEKINTASDAIKAKFKL